MIETIIFWIVVSIIKSVIWTILSGKIRMRLISVCELCSCLTMKIFKNSSIVNLMTEALKSLLLLLNRYRSYRLYFRDYICRLWSQFKSFEHFGNHGTRTLTAFYTSSDFRPKYGHVTCTVDFKRLTRVDGLTSFYTSSDFWPKLDAIDALWFVAVS